MPLLKQSVVVPGHLGKLLSTMREGQAPEKFTRQYLKDIGFGSSNHYAFIPLLKGLGFLTAEGIPTDRYREFLDPTKWKKVIALSIREAYSDIFVIKSKPSKSDRNIIAGKYKSTYNLSEIAADRAAATFLALLELADKDVLHGNIASEKTPLEEKPTENDEEEKVNQVDENSEQKHLKKNSNLEFHYNIQIHLPPTKDIEVYNAIFKSLKEHIVE